tara:strand:+ start:1351 stop:1557 length:207 start_codon:yes stop_codon:yes gene_type:complete
MRKRARIDIPLHNISKIESIVPSSLGSEDDSMGFHTNIVIHNEEGELLILSCFSEEFHSLIPQVVKQG